VDDPVKSTQDIDLTPPPSPMMKEAGKQMATKVGGVQGKWEWWQGYQMERKLLGFEAPAGKNAVLITKKGPRKKKKDDD
jgi:hypothetical protein